MWPLHAHHVMLSQQEVHEDAGKGAVLAKTDGLTRTTVVWRGWDVAGPKAAYPILNKL